jgi:hypothetical protein
MMDSPGERDRVEVDALITDRYLEMLLAAHTGAADLHVPDAPGEAPPADIARAADRLSRDLLRLHPSFRFEEALALRLADAAARMRLARVAGGEGTVVTLRDRDLDPLIPLTHETSEAGTAGVDDLHPGFGRPLIIGGALTSAALSIAGVYVAWRLNRPAGPMARAVRAVARARLA